MTEIIKNRYELLDTLGSGAMGVVHSARDRLTGQTVALKLVAYSGTFHIDMTDTLEFLLAQEFQTLASLRHPNIVSVLDYGFVSHDQPFFTMTYLENARPLDMAAAGYDMEGRIDLILQLLQAVAYLHRRRILHRDLKPSNVMVTPQGEVKVLDFGIAMDFAERRSLAGTPHYMAPELFHGTPPSRQSDLFAVGVMAYGLLANYYPFTSDEKSTIQAIIEDEPDYSRLPDLISRIEPVSLREILMRLLAKDPAHRYAYAETAMADLALLLGQELTQESTAVRESFLQAARFVGRKNELQQVEDALFRGLTSYGSAWLISGESGVGKSRFLREVRVRGMVQDFQVLTVTGDAERPNSFHIWRAALRQMTLARPPLLEDARILKTIIPDIEKLIGADVPDLFFDSADAEREALAWAIMNLFKRAKQPILLILDDAHWMGDSLAPAQLLLDYIGGLPVVMLISYRSDDYPHFPELLPDMRRIALKRLTPNEMLELSTSMLGQTPPQLADLLLQETDGNTFFLVEALRALSEDAGGLGAIMERPLPAELFGGDQERLIERRLRQVPEWALNGLQMAAVMGRELDLPSLGRMMYALLAVAQSGDISLTVSTSWRSNRAVTLEDWVLLCADAAILELHEGQWRFAHDKLRDYLINGMEAAQRQMIHSQAAKAIEAVYPMSRQVAARIAQHWQRANQPEKAAKYRNYTG